MTPKLPEAISRLGDDWHAFDGPRPAFLTLADDGTFCLARASGEDIQRTYTESITTDTPIDESWFCRKAMSAPLVVYSADNTQYVAYYYDEATKSWSAFCQAPPRRPAPDETSPESLPDDSPGALDQFFNVITRVLGDPDAERDLRHYRRARSIELPPSGELNLSGDTLNPIALYANGFVTVPETNYPPHRKVSYARAGLHLRRERGRCRLLRVYIGEGLETQTKVLSFERGVWWEWLPCTPTVLNQWQCRREHLVRRGRGAVRTCWSFAWKLALVVILVSLIYGSFSDS